jgi:hypothetical protein
MTLTHDHRIPRRDFLRLWSAAGLAVVPGIGLPLALFGRPDDNLNCIYISNTGGMSHLDLWDPKPDAPTEIRGDFSAIATNVPGVFLSELLPETARIADKLAIVRCMTHDEFDHAQACREMIWSAPLPLPVTGQLCPGIVGWAVPTTTGGNSVGTAHPTGCEQPGFLAKAVSEPEQRLEALPARLKHASRMIEDGCHFVNVESGHWDTHRRNAWCLKNLLAPAFDQAFSALIADLSERGLLASTLVVVATEFGRSPHINTKAGRDHWPHAFSIVLAGGGVEGGRAIGRTDRHGASVVDQI